MVVDILDQDRDAEAALADDFQALVVFHSQNLISFAFVQMRELLLVLRLQVGFQGQHEHHSYRKEVEEMFHAVVVVRGKSVSKAPGVHPGLDNLTKLTLAYVRAKAM